MNLLEIGHHYINLDHARRVVIQDSTRIRLEFHGEPDLPLEGEEAEAVLRHLQTTSQFIKVERVLADGEHARVD